MGKNCDRVVVLEERFQMTLYKRVLVSPPVWHIGQLNLWFCHISLNNYPFLFLLLSILLCRFDINAGLMTANRRQMHGTEPEIDWNQLLVSQAEHTPQVFGVSLPKGTAQCKWTLSVCPESSWTCNILRNNFKCQHWGDSLQFLE